MCGIVGLASREPVEPSRIERLRDSMTHRGPDDAGAWLSSDRRVALGHRRLAIIDLSPGGHQPMSDPTGTVRVIFNGEIYNYQELRRELEGQGHLFKTASDTEVLLAAKNDEAAEAADADREVTRALLAGETGDLMYHALVLLAQRGLEPSAVVDVLRRRHGDRR